MTSGDKNGGKNTAREGCRIALTGSRGISGIQPNGAFMASAYDVTTFSVNLSGVFLLLFFCHDDIHILALSFPLPVQVRRNRSGMNFSWGTKYE